MTVNSLRPSVGFTLSGVVESGVEPLRCSAKGCRAPARWALRWNNPKLHEPERRKTWLACDDHLSSLSDFLAARSFLRETAPIPVGTGGPMSEVYRANHQAQDQ
jgi:hypothetical protein